MGGPVLTEPVYLSDSLFRRAHKLPRKVIVPSRTVPRTVLHRQPNTAITGSVLCVDGRERSSDLSFMSATL